MSQGGDSLVAVLNSEQTMEPFENIGSSRNMIQESVPGTTISSQNRVNREDDVYNIMILNQQNVLKEDCSEIFPFLKTGNETDHWVSNEVAIKESNLGPEQRVKCSSLQSKANRENYKSVYPSDMKNKCLSPKDGTQTMSDPLLGGTKNFIMDGLLQLLDSVGWGQKLAGKVNAANSSSLLNLKDVGSDISQHNQLLPRCTSMVDCQRGGKL